MEQRTQKKFVNLINKQKDKQTKDVLTQFFFSILVVEEWIEDHKEHLAKLNKKSISSICYDPYEYSEALITYYEKCCLELILEIMKNNQVYLDDMYGREYINKKLKDLGVKL